ncbi:DUF4968 domain-containing protein [Fulvivirga sp. M361]|uniref:glycoside hydrolase family 31 protein n=1 Tax=Fulvivirga sp. M361 TaxID=2594266 RepID=UPI00117BA4E0|nr:glycoside hydrolase family 31 protein [Fulvivirga sp. M361]TRX59514.1 DUF4968 domain-containing protein [Fulvivirga sp. M361]
MTDIDKHNTNQSLGDLRRYTKIDHGIEGHTSHGTFKVVVYNPHTIRIHATLAQYNDHSYAVVDTPSGDFKLEESETSLVITTSKIQLILYRTPVRFVFKDLKGNVINEDDAAFGTSWIGEQVSTYKKLQPDERFIGLGEKTGSLDRRGNGYQNWNTDNYAYHNGSDPLYCSTPFYIGIHAGQAYGIYFDNSHKTHFNFGASNNRFMSFAADRGDMNYYFIYDDSVSGIIEYYTQLTGRMELPPLWSIGYQQCRYSYYPDKEVLSTARTFREKDIPADVIVLDIHYMDQFKIFTWDKNHFPDPAGMIQTLKEQGFHVVVMCDPGIKAEDGYAPYESGKEHDIFLKYPDGTHYSGQVWPGWCYFPDFTKPEAREWWKNSLKSYSEIGIDGFWNDMNEIATWGNTLPELIEFDFDGNKTSSREGRNVYGLQMSRSTYEGTRELLNGKRPFNLTRSAFSGIQRYAAVWTGDNVANEEHMMLGVRLVNSLGLTGIAFAGYDIGGFVGNAHESLFARWLQIGAFSPFFRGHSMVNSRDSEPWSYGEEVEEVSRNFITLRYKLLPYLYSCFYMATKTGIPVSRSLAIYYPEDAHIYDGLFEQQYLFGPSLMVAPVESNASLAKVYLPEGEWYEFFTDKKHIGQQQIIAECSIETVPLYVKGSAIIPMAPYAKNNTQGLGTTLEIHIYYGQDKNEFFYYEDDGESYAYKEGDFHQRTIAFDPDKSQLKIAEVEGSYSSRFDALKICFHGFESSRFKVNSKLADTFYEDYRYIQKISNFDPVGDRRQEFVLKDLPYLLLDYTTGPLTISW